MTKFTAAEHLLHELGVTEPREIDLDAIAWHVGARINYIPLDGCEAQIIGYGNKAVIDVNSNSHPKRQRYSAGHELGHWYHHRGESSPCNAVDIEDYTSKARAREQVADRYAADLLMPAYLFVPRAQSIKTVSFDTVRDLGDEFCTSLTATALRIVALGPQPAMLLCHDIDERKWFRPGPAVPEDFFPKKEIDCSSGALDVVFGKEEKSRRKSVSASIWFNARDARKLELFEQSIRISETLSLTLLVFKSS